MPFPDKVLVERQVGKVQENYQQERECVVDDILRDKIPEFFFKKIRRFHQLQS
jgi:hypothetical protein